LTSGGKSRINPNMFIECSHVCGWSALSPSA
jgi:hypothetical protein